MRLVISLSSIIARHNWAVLATAFWERLDTHSQLLLRDKTISVAIVLLGDPILHKHRIEITPSTCVPRVRRCVDHRSRRSLKAGVLIGIVGVRDVHNVLTKVNVLRNKVAGEHLEQASTVGRSNSAVFEINVAVVDKRAKLDKVRVPKCSSIS